MVAVGSAVGWEASLAASAVELWEEGATGASAEAVCWAAAGSVGFEAAAAATAATEAVAVSRCGGSSECGALWGLSGRRV